MTTTDRKRLTDLPDAWVDDATARIALAKREALEVIAEDDRVDDPSDVTSFGDLHDYCDANVLGGLCDESGPLDVTPLQELGLDGQPLTEEARENGESLWWLLGEVVQNEVDNWIREGGHLPITLTLEDGTSFQAFPA